MLEKRLQRIVTAKEMQSGFMPGRATIDALFILRRLQEENCAKIKVVYVFCGPRESS